MKVHRIFLFFVLGLLCLALTGCGGNNSSSNNSGTTGGTSGGTTGGTSGGTTGGTSGGTTGGTSGGTNTGGSNGGSSGGTGSGTSGATGGLYVYTVSGSSLAGFQFSADQHSLTPLNGLKSAAPLNNMQLATTPSGEFLYTFQNSCAGTACSKAFDNTLYVQTVGSDGSLTDPRLPFPSLTQPIQVLVSPASKYAFVLSGPNTNTVSVFPIQEDGTFGTQAGSVAIPHITPDPTFGGATYTTMVGFTQTGGTYLWVTQNDVDRSGNTPKLVSIQYDASNGTIIDTKTTSFTSIAAPETAAIVGDTLVSSEAGMFSSISPGLTTSNLSGGMATLAQHCTTVACTSVTSLVAHPSQRWVFGARQTGGAAFEIQTYSIGADGSITPVGNAIRYPSATFIHLAPSANGKYLFVTRTSDSMISALAIDQTTGALSEVTSTSVDSPKAIATAER